MDSIPAQNAQKKFDLLTNETSGPSPTKEQLSDAREFLRYWSLINFMEIDEHRRILINSKIQDDQTIFSTLVLDYKRELALFRENKNNSKTGTIADKDLEHALGLKIRDYHDNLIRDLRNKINSEPSAQGLNELRKLVKALTGDERDYEVFLFAHWLQQVKRKVNGINPKWQMMLVLYGSQGSGKTETIRKLIKVFHGLYSLLSVEQLVDIRVKNSVEDNYIIFLDELMGVEKADMSKLKSCITDYVSAHRQLHTKRASNINNNASFIAASNKPLFENFKDRTGLRRFAEIKTLPRIDWELVNSIDFTDIWKSIDINEEYYSLIQDQLSEIQGADVSSDAIDFFIEDYGISNAGNIKPHPTETLNLRFQEWARLNGYKNPPNRNDFTKSLQERCLLMKNRLYVDGRRSVCLSLSSVKPLLVDGSAPWKKKTEEKEET